MYAYDSALFARMVKGVGIPMAGRLQAHVCILLGWCRRVNAA
jgi:hypothetical protein